MPLAKLRAQMLIAMGLAPQACWTGAAPPPPPAPKPITNVQRDFDAATCVRDSVPETVCGERRETARSCGAKATNLDSIEDYRLAVTSEDSDNPKQTYRDFVFDRDATQKFRDEQEAEIRASHCCYSRCTAITVGPPDQVTLAAGARLGNKCMPAPPNGTSRPAKEDPACPEGVLMDGAMRPYVSTDEGQCCYSIPMRIQIHSIPGRALRIDGVPQVAAIAERAGWSEALAPCVDLDPAVRDRLAAAWLASAQYEHASVAAFAALAVRLLGAGAPMELIAAAHEAALDEVRHAQLAFALASAYAGTPLGPGRFDAASRAAIDGDVRSLALETFVDGCIGETAAAHQAELAAASARDPEVTRVLAEIAEDEARHGALAWAIVAWCVREGAVTVAELAELATAAELPVRELVDDLAVRRFDATAANVVDDLAVHGVLSDPAPIRAAVLRDVVHPCLHALAA